jgi:Polyketide cyclase / dehydrase and lipid transport
MRTWHAQTTVAAPPCEVLEVLTHPAALARWSPVGFEIEELDDTRLRSGTRARVAGCLAGRRVRFDVDVMQADPERLLLHARGPVGMDVDYTIAPALNGSAVDAAITVRGQRGMTKAIIARSLHLFLAVGGLEVALARLVREVENRYEASTPRASRAASSASRSCASIRSRPVSQKPGSARSTPTILPSSSGLREPPAESSSR